MTKTAYHPKIAQARPGTCSSAGTHSIRTETAQCCLTLQNSKGVKSGARSRFALYEGSGILLASGGVMLTCLQKIIETNVKLEEVKPRHYTALRPYAIIKILRREKI
jgi:hypothetical protein